MFLQSGEPESKEFVVNELKEEEKNSSFKNSSRSEMPIEEEVSPLFKA
jgi:hypothetical protein